MARSVITQKWVYKVGNGEVIRDADEWRRHGWYWLPHVGEWWKMSSVPMKIPGGARMVLFSVDEKWATEQWEAYD